jgi:hypothetical protein
VRDVYKLALDSVRSHIRCTSLRGNVDVLQLPDAHRVLALALKAPCVACGKDCHLFRARLKSERSRVAGAEERRLFYSATCSPGCSRSKAAKEHKREVLAYLGAVKSKYVRVVFLDAVGQVVADLTAQPGSECHIPVDVAKIRIVE